MKLVKNITDQGFQLPGNVIFSAVVCEEAAEMFGMEYLCKETLPKKQLVFDVCYLAEPTTGNVNLGHRGKIEIVVKTQGRTAHSSRPWQGINALQKMVPVLEEIFSKMGPRLPIHPELGQCSITVTNIVSRPGGLSIVPDECEISVDRRYAPEETTDGILTVFKELFTEIKKSDPDFEGSAKVRDSIASAYTGYTKRVQKHHPVWILRKDHPFVQKTCQALRRIGRQANLGYFTGGVDGAMTAGLMGIPTIGYSGADEKLAHTPEEHLPIATLIQDKNIR